MRQVKKGALNFGDNEINIQLTGLGECWWNLSDLCEALDIELLKAGKDEKQLRSVIRELRIETSDIRAETREDGEVEIMLNFPGLEKLIDYAGEVRRASVFCEWIIETAFPLIWENQKGEKEEEQEETLILIKTQNQGTPETGLIAA